MADPQQMVFDAAPVKQDTPVPQAATSQSSPAPGGMVFDAAPVTQDTPVASAQSTTHPNNVYQAAPDENTPEGAAAALARRQAEHPILTAVGQGAGEALSDVWNFVKGTPQGLLHSLPPVQLHDSIKQAIPVFQAYEQARSSGKNVIASLAVANEVAKQQDAVQQALAARIDEFKKKPGAESVRAIANAATIAATMYDGGVLNPANAELPAGVSEANAAARAAETAEAKPITHTFDAESNEVQPAKPGTIQQVIKGANVVKQPEIQGAVRSGINAASKESGVSTVQPESMRDSASGHISALEDAEDAAYKAQDEASGTDIKQLRENLRNAQYQKSLLTKTPADIEKAKELDTSIQATQDEINAANSRLQAKGIDPGAADNLFKARQAAQEFEDKVLHNQGVIKGDAAAGQPETVDVDALVRESQKLYDKDKFGGSRLEQFMGKDGAAAYMKQVRGLQTARMTAAARQAGALKILKALGVGGGILGGTALGLKGIESLAQ